MPRVTCHMTLSLDGFVAGPDQSFDNPMGRDALAMHAWHIGGDLDAEEQRMRDALMAPKGAYVMGRNMYGPVRGGWESWPEPWTGWWGDEPPYHAPVFVLTHHAHDPVVKEGGTTFHFVTGGFEAALTAAQEAAGDLDVDVAGGASTVQQALRADVVDELILDVAPVLLGSGERLFDGVERFGLTPVEVTGSPRATFVRYSR